MKQGVDVPVSRRRRGMALGVLIALGAGVWVDRVYGGVDQGLLGLRFVAVYAVPVAVLVWLAGGLAVVRRHCQAGILIGVGFVLGAAWEVSGTGPLYGDRLSRGQAMVLSQALADYGVRSRLGQPLPLPQDYALPARYQDLLALIREDMSAFVQAMEDYRILAESREVMAVWTPKVLAETDGAPPVLKEMRASLEQLRAVQVRYHVDLADRMETMALPQAEARRFVVTWREGMTQGRALMEAFLDNQALLIDLLAELHQVCAALELGYDAVDHRLVFPGRAAVARFEAVMRQLVEAADAEAQLTAEMNALQGA